MMRYFLDFDHTLFNTDQFFRVELPIVLARFEIDQKIWKETYAELLPLGYSLERHLDVLSEKLNLPSEEIQKAMKEHFQNGERFVFQDVKPFFQQAKSQYIPLYLLSFGLPEWQQYKLSLSGLAPFFEDIFITEKEGNKKEIIGRYAEKGAVLMVDNNAKELDSIKKAHPEVVTYWINRVPEALRLPKNKADEAAFEGARKYLDYTPMYQHISCQSLLEVNREK